MLAPTKSRKSVAAAPGRLFRAGSEVNGDFASARTDGDAALGGGGASSSRSSAFTPPLPDSSRRSSSNSINVKKSEENCMARARIISPDLKQVRMLRYDPEFNAVRALA